MWFVLKHCVFTELSYFAVFFSCVKNDAYLCGLLWIFTRCVAMIFLLLYTQVHLL